MQQTLYLLKRFSSVCYYSLSFTRDRDLSPSIAVAIAEGNLDPCTMEAFDHFPQPGYKQKLSFPDSASQLSTQGEATGPMQEGCFTVVSCHKIVKKRIRGQCFHLLIIQV